jgi:hypothetical protein
MSECIAGIGLVEERRLSAASEARRKWNRIPLAPRRWNRVPMDDKSAVPPWKSGPSGPRHRLTRSEPSPVGTAEPPHLEKIAASLPALAKNARRGTPAVPLCMNASRAVEERRFSAATEAEENGTEFRRTAEHARAASRDVEEQRFSAASEPQENRTEPVGTEEPPHLEKRAASLPALAKNARPCPDAAEGTQVLTQPEENGIKSRKDRTAR